MTQVEFRKPWRKQAVQQEWNRCKPHVPLSGVSLPINACAALACCSICSAWLASCSPNCVSWLWPDLSRLISTAPARFSNRLIRRETVVASSLKRSDALARLSARAIASNTRRSSQFICCIIAVYSCIYGHCKCINAAIDLARSERRLICSTQFIFMDNANADPDIRPTLYAATPRLSKR